MAKSDAFDGYRSRDFAVVGRLYWPCILTDVRMARVISLAIPKVLVKGFSADPKLTGQFGLLLARISPAAYLSYLFA